MFGQIEDGATGSKKLVQESLDEKVMTKERIGNAELKEKEKLAKVEKTIFKFNKKGKLTEEEKAEIKRTSSTGWARVPRRMKQRIFQGLVE